MPQIEFGHIYKFLASAGLALIVSSVVVPWIVLQSLASLDISRKRLASLTPTARSIIEGRQSTLLGAQDWLILLSIGLALGGVALLVVGLVGWWKRQRIADKGENVDVAAKEAAFAKMSGEQVDEKLEAEVSEDLEQPVTQAPESAGGQGGPQTQYSGSRAAHQASVERLRLNEDRLVQLLRSEYGQAYEVRPNVRVASGAAAGASVDVLLDSPPASSWSQLAIDLKVVRASSFAKNVSTRIETSMLSLAIASAGLRLGRVYTGSRGRPPGAGTSGIVLLVVETDDAAGLDEMFSRVQRHANATNSVLRRPIAVIVISSSRFEELASADLRTLVSDAWSTPEGATILVA